MFRSHLGSWEPATGPDHQPWPDAIRRQLANIVASSVFDAATATAAPTELA